MIKAFEIQVKEEKHQMTEAEATAKENAAPNDPESIEGFGSELQQPIWSVVSFESVAVSGLHYDEAVRWVEKLNSQKVSGLCSVTDEAAGRVSN